MKKLLVLLLAAAGCGPLEPSPVQEPRALAVGAEGLAGLEGRSVACVVELEQIEPPTSGPRYWVRATYRGVCYSGKPTYPYWPAPIWALAEPPGPGILAWGADPFVAYLWPEVPGTYTVTATSPVVKSDALYLTIK